MKRATGAPVDLAIPGKARIICLSLIIPLIIIVSCSPVQKSVETKPVDNVGKIDTTLYDLTYVEGIKQKLSGNIGEAINRFEKALTINPGSDAASYQISQISAMRRDYNNAKKYGLRAAETDSLNLWYMMNLANIYMEEGNIDTAAYWLEKVIKLEPENKEVEYQLGNIYMQTGRTEKAEDIFEGFYREYGGNEQILISLLNSKLYSGKYDEAEKILKRELSDDPDNVRLAGILAEVYRKSGQDEKADVLYKSLLEKEGSNHTLVLSHLEFLLEQKDFDKLFSDIATTAEQGILNTEEIVSLIMRLSQDTLVLNNFTEELEKIAFKIEDNYKDNPTVILMVAGLYDTINESSKSIEVLKNYIERDDKQYFIWENLLIKLNDNNESKMLADYAERASRLFNTAPLPKILYAYALIEDRKFDEAENELKKVRILVNNDRRFLVQILSIEAEIAYRKDNIDLAAEKFEEALEIEPENALILNNYAYYLAEKGQKLKYARELIQKCLDSEENITYLDTYAWVLYKLGKYGEAERIMQKIFESARINDAELLEHYGYIEKALKKCDRAVSLWQMALKNDKSKEYLIDEITKCMDTDQ